MWEMIENAWTGWLAYTDGGKLAALTIAAIVYLTLAVKLKGPKGRLVLYGGVLTVLCICPVSAAILMVYQTRFYDYQWIWSLVPVTALIALGGTMFLTGQWKSGKGWKIILHNGVVTVASVLLLFLCGGMGKGSVDTVQAELDRGHAEAVLEEVRQLYGDEVCLWAPADILEYARFNSKMQLLYGRNMWDVALNAYSYDIYSEEQKELYQWMEYLDDWDIEISVAEVEENVLRGFRAGADCILLPAEMSDWLEGAETEDLLLECLGAEDSREVTVLEGYYLVKLR